MNSGPGILLKKAIEWMILISNTGTTATGEPKPEEPIPTTENAQKLPKNSRPKPTQAQAAYGKSIWVGLFACLGVSILICSLCSFEMNFG